MIGFWIRFEAGMTEFAGGLQCGMRKGEESSPNPRVWGLSHEKNDVSTY